MIAVEVKIRISLILHDDARGRILTIHDTTADQRWYLEALAGSLSLIIDSLNIRKSPKDMS